jgi:hypothetical protein
MFSDVVRMHHVTRHTYLFLVGNLQTNWETSSDGTNINKRDLNEWPMRMLSLIHLTPNRIQ